MSRSSASTIVAAVVVQPMISFQRHFNKYAFTRTGNIQAFLYVVFLTTHLSSRAQATAVTLSWLSAPTDQSQLLGSDVTFDCLVRNVGNTTIVWTKIDDDRSQTILFYDQFNFAAPDRYSLVTSPDGTGKKLIIHGITEDDDASYQCTVQRFNTSTARLTVLVVPGDPAITTNASSSPWREGDVIQIVCNSTGGNPPPSIIWYRNGDVIPPNSAGVSLVTSPTKFGTTNGQLVRTLTSSDDGANYTCLVKNQAAVSSGQIVSNSLQLNVLYGPVISFGRYNPLAVVNSTDVTLTCYVKSNPPVDSSTITWYYSNQFKGYGSTLRLQSVSATRDTGVYQCTAYNAVNTSTAQLTLDVQYGPKPAVSVNGAAASSWTAVEGSTLTVSCSATVANPPVSATWWSKDGLTIPTVSGSNALVIPSVNRSQAGLYLCNAVNTLAPSGESPMNVTGSTSLSLKVLYLPGKTTIIKPARIIKDDVVTLTCTVDDSGNPAGTLSWYRAGVNVGYGSALVINGAQLSDSGNYSCVASNSVGNGTTSTAVIDVYEKPEWLSNLLPSQTTTSINATDQLFLTCQAHGKPKPEVTWMKDGQQLSSVNNGLYQVDTNYVFSPDLLSWIVTSSLRFQGSVRTPANTSIQISDAGNYTCIANSSILASSIAQSTQVIVYFPPKFTQVPSVVGAELHQTATLTVHAIALPAPSFTWYNGTVPVGLTNSPRIKVIVSGDVRGQGQVTTFTSTLNITDAAEWDLRNYTVVASNQYGVNQTTVMLTRASTPEAPRLPTVTPMSWESALLSWTPGFDGGKNQEFSVTYFVTLPNLDNQTSTNTSTPPSVAIVTTNATQVTVSGLYPSVNYTFIICSFNVYGQSSRCANISTQTPGYVIPSPLDVTFNTKTNLLSFVTPAALVSAESYCLRVEVSDIYGMWSKNNPCLTYQSSDSVAVQSNSVVTDLRASLCLLRRNDICSQSTSAKLVSSDVPTTTMIVVGCVCGAVLVLLCIILAFLCLRRRRMAKSKHKDKNHSISSPSSSPLSCDMASPADVHALATPTRSTSTQSSQVAEHHSLDRNDIGSNDVNLFNRTGQKTNGLHNISYQDNPLEFRYTNDAVPPLPPSWKQNGVSHAPHRPPPPTPQQFWPYAGGDNSRNYLDLSHQPFGRIVQEPTTSHPSNRLQPCDRNFSSSCTTPVSDILKPKKIIHEVIV